MKKLMILFVLACAVTFISCEKDTVEDIDPYGKVEVTPQSPGTIFSSRPEDDPTDG